MMLVGTTVTLGVSVYPPHNESITVIYWTLLAAVCLQALAMQVHRCFATGSTLTGIASTLYLTGIVAVPSHLWMRFAFECGTECYGAAVTKPTLLHSQDVHHAAQFSSIVAAMATIVCLGRWISVRMIHIARAERREGIVEAANPTRLRRYGATAQRRTVYLDREDGGATETSRHTSDESSTEET